MTPGGSASRSKMAGTATPSCTRPRRTRRTAGASRSSTPSPSAGETGPRRPTGTRCGSSSETGASAPADTGRRIAVTTEGTAGAEFRITATATEGGADVVVAGEIDLATAPQLRSELHAIIDGGATVVAVDMADVGFID